MVVATAITIFRREKTGNYKLFSITLGLKKALRLILKLSSAKLVASIKP